MARPRLGWSLALLLGVAALLAMAACIPTAAAIDGDEADSSENVATAADVAAAADADVVAAGQPAGRVTALSARVSYAAGPERVARHRLAARVSDSGVVDTAMPGPPLRLEDGDSLTVRAAVVDGAGKPLAPAQAFVRFVRRREEGAAGGKLQSVHLMKPRGEEMHLELSLKRLMAADPSFWTPDTSYVWSVLIGDAAIPRGVTWTASSEATLGPSSTYRPASTRTPGVFEFDLRVPHGLLPEFEAPMPPPRRGPPFVVIAIAVAAVLAPLAAFVVALATRPGAMAVKRGGGGDPAASTLTPSTTAFGACLVGVAAVLVRFWVGWRLTTTFGALALLAPLTLAAGYSSLRGVAARPPRSGSTLQQPYKAAQRAAKAE
ncbi:hypothetical protein MMPV_007607 [Pyropia vietnamensis]